MRVLATKRYDILSRSIFVSSYREKFCSRRDATSILSESVRGGREHVRQNGGVENDRVRCCRERDSIMFWEKSFVTRRVRLNGGST